jgi:hypothetical protein
LDLACRASISRALQLLAEAGCAAQHKAEAASWLNGRRKELLTDARSQQDATGVATGFDVPTSQAEFEEFCQDTVQQTLMIVRFTQVL